MIHFSTLPVAARPVQTLINVDSNEKLIFGVFNLESFVISCEGMVQIQVTLLIGLLLFGSFLSGTDSIDDDDSIIEALISHGHAELLNVEVFKHLLIREVQALKSTCHLLNGSIEEIGNLGQKEQDDLFLLLQNKDTAAIKGHLMQMLRPGKLYKLDFVDPKESNGVLYWAVFSGHDWSVLAWLKARGASFHPALVKQMLTVLMFNRNAPKILPWLINNGCPLAIASSYNCACLFVMMGKAGLLQILTETGMMGRIVNVPDAQGRTPIFFARWPQVAKTLLGLGADPQHQDNTGRTAVEFMERDFQVDAGLLEILNQ